MMKHLFKLSAMLFILIWVAAPASAVEKKDSNTFDQETVLKDATEFFGQGAEGLAKVIEKAFKDHGRPNAYIKGEEAGGALVAGLRYGDGVLVRKTGKSRKVFWSSPTIGFDYGANAAKVFVLVYNLDNAEKLFRRYPAVDGSFYFVAGAGINYQQRDKVILAPIRLGVGLRAGANIGYINYTKKKTYNPL